MNIRILTLEWGGCNRVSWGPKKKHKSVWSLEQQWGAPVATEVCTYKYIHQDQYRKEIEKYLLSKSNN